jgi:hypothetical protein
MGWRVHASDTCTDARSCVHRATALIRLACRRRWPQVYKWFRDLPGYKVVTTSPSYNRDYTLSKFCLAPPGGGWGKRGVLAALMGCVPVVIGDWQYQPWEPHIPWDSYSVRLAEADIPRLPGILAAVSEEEVEAKRVSAAGVCWAAHELGLPCGMH